MSRLRKDDHLGSGGARAPRRLGRVDEQLPGARVDNRVLGADEDSSGHAGRERGRGRVFEREEEGGRAAAHTPVVVASGRLDVGWAVRRGVLGRADRQRRRDPRDRAQRREHRGRRLDLRPQRERRREQRDRAQLVVRGGRDARGRERGDRGSHRVPEQHDVRAGRRERRRHVRARLGRVLDEALATVDEAGGLLAHRAAAGVALEAQAVAVLLERVERAAERDEARREPPRGERLRRFVHAVEEDDRRRDRAVRTVGARPRLDVQLPAATAVEERRRAGRFDGGGGRLLLHGSSLRKIWSRFIEISMERLPRDAVLARVAACCAARELGSLTCVGSYPLRSVAVSAWPPLVMKVFGQQAAPGQGRQKYLQLFQAGRLIECTRYGLEDAPRQVECVRPQKTDVDKDSFASVTFLIRINTGGGPSPEVDDIEVEFAMPGEVRQGRVAHGDGAYLEFAPNADPIKWGPLGRERVLETLLSSNAAFLARENEEEEEDEDGDYEDPRKKALERLGLQIWMVAMRSDGATARISAWDMWGYDRTCTGLVQYNGGDYSIRFAPGQMRVEFSRAVDLHEMVPAIASFFDNDDLGDLLSFTLGLDVNEENLSLRLALCNRYIDPSGDGLYPSDLPTFARVVHALLDQSSRPPIRVPAAPPWWD